MAATPPSASPGLTPQVRRTDLDALRGFAMFLGIVLHASLSFFPCPWPVQDTRQNGLFFLVYALIHEFRMPLFFLISGFFTMFMVQKYGLREMLRQRAARVLLPLLLALLTITPLTLVLDQEGRALTRQTGSLQDPYVSAVLQDQPETVRQAVAQVGHQWTDPIQHLTLLYWSALLGKDQALRALLENGAKINEPVSAGNTPLHAAAFFAHPESVRILLQNGADPLIRNQGGRTPREYAIAMFRSRHLAYEDLGLPIPNDSLMAKNQEEVFHILSEAEKQKAGSSFSYRLETAIFAYHAFLQSDRFRFSLGNFSVQIFATKIFDHLWFLWLLSWLVLGLALAIRGGFSPSGRHLPWIPAVSLLPQTMMTGLGPDLWMGLIFPPHMVLYYGCFFWFGAAVFSKDGMKTRLGSRWPLLLPLGFLILTPAGLFSLPHHLLNSVIQALIAWVLTFGFIGLFGRYGSSLGYKARWLSDACYWMYLAHLPLVLFFQTLVFRWSWPTAGKFLFVNLFATVFLLLSYEWFVRYTWVGTLLNGPRKKPARAV